MHSFMKFPSINFLINQAGLSFRRFPLAILSAAFAVFIAIYLVEVDGDFDSLMMINLLLCGYLGVPLFISAYIFSTCRRWADAKLWILRAAVMLLLVLVYVSLPGTEDSLNVSISYIRYVVFAVAAHLLVSFSGYIGRGDVEEFWKFNQTLFLRFLLSALYSIVLFLGLVLGLFALDSLFDLDIDGKRYFQIFIFIAGVFNTWFFTAGVPAAGVPDAPVHFSENNSKDEKSLSNKGLRTLLLYVLLPLISLYFVILYSYSVKVVFLWDWPKGIMTYMIIAMAVIGILTFLLSYPFARERSPLAFLNRWYFVVLFPLLAMLFLAIGIRIADYGITINRYLTVLLAIWLLLISIYFVFIGKNIKAIPMTLFVLILITCFGPWGIFEVSERSQVNRLEQILRNSEILKDHITNEPIWDVSDTSRLVLIDKNRNQGVLSDSLHNEVYSVINYLDDFHGLSSIDHWFTQSPFEIAEAHDLSENSIYMQMLGLEHRRIYRNSNSTVYRYFNTENTKKDFRDIRAYDYSLPINWQQNGIVNKNPLASDRISGLNVGWSGTTIDLMYQDSLSYSLNVQGLYEKQESIYGMSKQNLQEDEMTISFNEDWIQGELVLSNMSGYDSLNRYSGVLVLRLE